MNSHYVCVCNIQPCYNNLENITLANLFALHVDKLYPLEVNGKVECVRIRPEAFVIYWEQHTTVEGIVFH